MNFTYQGFTTNDGKRRFTFWSSRTEDHPITTYLIEVDLLLLARLRVPVQDGPVFCLELLNTARTAGLASLAKLHRYQLAEEDFRPLLVQREKAAADKAAKRSLRKPFAKPSPKSNLVLGPSAETRSH